MQAIYATFAGDFDPSIFFNDMLARSSGDSRAVDFSRELFEGTIEHLKDIDGKIAGALKNWTLDRLASVDLAILRLAIFEMFYREDIPLTVSINEAIELSKAFSTTDSKRLVNGVLDGLKRAIERKGRLGENFTPSGRENRRRL